MSSPTDIANEVRAKVWEVLSQAPFSIHKASRDSIISRSSWESTLKALNSLGSQTRLAVVGVDQGTESKHSLVAGLRDFHVDLWLLAGREGCDQADPMSTLDSMLEAMSIAWSAWCSDVNDGPASFCWDGRPPVFDSHSDNEMQRMIDAQGKGAVAAMLRWTVRAL